jgi:alanine-glyoxylate transaminase/serine-glyoxylate transaminase/serine-pyruvate transaminase
MFKSNASGYFPYTPATNLLYGLREAIVMLEEEGLANVFARHDRHAEATRRAVRAWGLEILCQNPDEYSSALTAVVLPPGHDADRFRSLVLQHFDMSLGTGLAKLQGKVFRIGHLGDFNDLTLMGTWSPRRAWCRAIAGPHNAATVTASSQIARGDISC